MRRGIARTMTSTENPEERPVRRYGFAVAVVGVVAAMTVLIFVKGVLGLKPGEGGGGGEQRMAAAQQQGGPGKGEARGPGGQGGGQGGAGPGAGGPGGGQGGPGGGRGEVAMVEAGL